MVFIDHTHFMLKNTDPEIAPLLHDSFSSSAYTVNVESNATHARRENHSVCSDTSKVKMSVMFVYFFLIPS